MKIILASASPRRRELLYSVCKEFEIKVAETDETLGDGVAPREGVMMLAVRKGSAVFDIIEEKERNACVIISSDTLVELDGVPLGKPTDTHHAKEMLRSLSGKRHNVHTGIAVRVGESVYSGVATTGVYFKEMTDLEIEEYIKTGEPMDKAGAYGIQGDFAIHVKGIEGDYYNVVGLPIGKVYQELKQLL